MSIVQQLKIYVSEFLQAIYKVTIAPENIAINDIKSEFEGEYAVVTFSMTKLVQSKPDEIATQIGSYLLSHHATFIQSVQVVKGFLNISICNAVYLQHLQQFIHSKKLPVFDPTNQKIMVEYSSPNTNKPLHFGHLRNIFLVYSIAEILKKTGNNVVKANLINDRGIHICKSMIAWMLYADNATPESTNTKGDHFVGDYYVKFNTIYKEQIETLLAQGISKDVAEKEAPIMLQTQDLLVKWEAGDTETLALWKKMNDWVYGGFDVTYKKLGVDFDRYYYESNTYLLGKKMVEEGLQEGKLIQKADNSIWIDLTQEGLDEKLLLRKDGTSVYITQDMGTANLKYQDEKMDASIYVIGDEQNYHMQVLKLILQKLGKEFAKGIHHLSYGMVELPHGKMKSREGTVVDADDMVDEMTTIAKKNTEELGKVDGFTEQELTTLYNTIGLGALKFYLLRVDPKKKMIFNPKESIDLHGFTGPFVQYTHARICSILRKADTVNTFAIDTSINKEEKILLKNLEQYQAILLQAANEQNPAVVCNYIFTIAKEYNSYLVQNPILKAEDTEIKNVRLSISLLVQQTIKDGLALLGIQAPERM